MAENKLKDVTREKTEKETAVQMEKETAVRNLSRCLGMLSNLLKKLQPVRENADEIGNESEAEMLDRHLEHGMVSRETTEEWWSFAEKLNLDLVSGLDALMQEMRDKDAEVLEKQKELGRLWTCVQEERLHRVNVEDSLQKLKNTWFQSQEETRTLFAQLQEKVRLLEDAESHIKCLHEEIHKVREENTVLSEASTASSDLIRQLEKAILTDKEKLQKLEADSEQQSSILQQVRYVGLDPENLVPSINELNAKLTAMKRMLEQERSEQTALREKLGVLDEFVKKNVLLEVDICHLETQMDELRDKVKFLEESCKSLLEERSNLTHENESLFTQLQEKADQSKKLKEMNLCLETSLADANSQLQALMMRAKGIKDYLQNAEKDHEDLQNKYSVLEKEKESLMSKIVQLQIELEMKEECEEELAKSLDANMDGLFSQRGMMDREERNSSLVFKFQSLIEAWKFSQVQISYLEHENLVQQSDLQFLSDQIDAGKEAIYTMLNSISKVSPLEESFESNHEDMNNMIQKAHDWQESLACFEETYLESAVEKSVLGLLLVQIKRESVEVISDLNTLRMENLHLQKLLERSANEMGEIKSENGLLQCEILCGKDLLSEKESRNMTYENMLRSVNCEKKEMQRKLYNLKMELTNTKLAKEDQEKKILNLEDELTRQILKSGYLLEEIKRLECQLLEVSKEYHNVCRKEQTRVDEIKTTEACIAAVFCDFVSSSLREAMLEHRFLEAAEARQNERKSENREIERLRGIVLELENDNDKLRSQLDILKAEMISSTEPGIEKNGRACVNAADAMKDTEKSNPRKQDSVINSCGKDEERIPEMLAFHPPAPEISVAQNEFMTKEIVLDQSFGFFSYAGGRSLAVEAEDRMLELWETSDASSIIDLQVSKPPRANRLDDSKFDDEARKDGNSVPDLCEESLYEKELGVDKREVSESAEEHKQGVSKRRLLERLNADAQKLTNLHITLNDLQRMVELILRSRQEQGGEYDTVNAQLEEARTTTTKLSEANTKLIKAVEKRFNPRPTKPTSEANDDGGSFLRRRISEKARRGSDKVAKLQSEVQKMQFLLLKLGEQKENKGRATRAVDRKPRVLLKDYLNSRLRGGNLSVTGGGGQKAKKGHFCACVQIPNTRS
ncbi:hypothetical protein MLD38_031827 [Melastoma candidum]|nr:hypothetical protein MLD38_031827 [Melastoma candidum]